MRRILEITAKNLQKTLKTLFMWTTGHDYGSYCCLKKWRRHASVLPGCSISGKMFCGQLRTFCLEEKVYCIPTPNLSSTVKHGGRSIMFNTALLPRGLETQSLKEKWIIKCIKTFFHGECQKSLQGLENLSDAIRQTRITQCHK